VGVSSQTGRTNSSVMRGAVVPDWPERRLAMIEALAWNARDHGRTVRFPRSSPTAYWLDRLTSSRRGRTTRSTARPAPLPPRRVSPRSGWRATTSRSTRRSSPAAARKRAMHRLTTIWSGADRITAPPRRADDRALCWRAAIVADLQPPRRDACRPRGMACSGVRALSGLWLQIAGYPPPCSSGVRDSGAVCSC
jgi:hypothetical protein